MSKFVARAGCAHARATAEATPVRRNWIFFTCCLLLWGASRSPAGEGPPRCRTRFSDGPPLRGFVDSVLTLIVRQRTISMRTLAHDVYPRNAGQLRRCGAA